MSKYLCADCVIREQCDCEWTMRCARYVPKEHKQTNEEYIKSLNTEQLAGLLYEYRYDNATPQQRLWLAENEKYCNKCIAEWLKEPHTGGEP